MTTVWIRLTRGTGVQNAPITLRWRPAVGLTLRTGRAPSPARIMINISEVRECAASTTTAFAIALFNFFPRL